ncbi:MAG: nucleotidyltransferase domain-containing protein [Kofleriaceae bacterium]|nr:nucleotidyltransferase domain-containing protein [Kofleriaceae bacterium]
MDRNELIRRLANFEYDDGIVVVYLFGSAARGTAVVGSDVDVAVLYRGSRPKNLENGGFGLQDRLTIALQLPVDLVVPSHAPSDLVHRVLNDGIVVVELDRAARLAFEVQRGDEYFVLRPYLLRYRGLGA